MYEKLTLFNCYWPARLHNYYVGVKYFIIPDCYIIMSELTKPQVGDIKSSSFSIC